MCWYVSNRLLLSSHPYTHLLLLAPHPQSLPRCCGLPVTVIEGSWPEQCDDGGGGAMDGRRERHEKRKGGGKSFI